MAPGAYFPRYFEQHPCWKSQSTAGSVSKQTPVNVSSTVQMHSIFCSPWRSVISEQRTCRGDPAQAKEQSQLPPMGAIAQLSVHCVPPEPAVPPLPPPAPPVPPAPSSGVPSGRSTWLAHPARRRRAGKTRAWKARRGVMKGGWQGERCAIGKSSGVWKILAKPQRLRGSRRPRKKIENAPKPGTGPGERCRYACERDAPSLKSRGSGSEDIAGRSTGRGARARAPRLGSTTTARRRGMEGWVLQ